MTDWMDTRTDLDELTIGASGSVYRRGDAKTSWVNTAVTPASTGSPPTTSGHSTSSQPTAPAST